MKKNFKSVVFAVFALAFQIHFAGGCSEETTDEGPLDPTLEESEADAEEEGSGS